MIVAWGAETPTGRVTNTAWLRRTGSTSHLVRSVYDYAPPGRCRLFGAAVASNSVAFFEDLTLSDEEGRGARYPILRTDGPAWNFVAALERDTIFKFPQDLDFSDALMAIRLAPSNRMLTVLNDGTYFFTAPAPPFEATRIHSTPSVVGEHWVATGLMSASANGLFMSHLGEPSIRIRDVDAVGEVVADETDIVWLEGSRLTEGIRLDGSTLWRAPWRPGPIDPDGARIIRPIEDVARIYPDVLNPGSAFLEMRLGDGYVAMHDQMVTACHVIRLADGWMARFDPPGFTCTNVYHVDASEVAVGVIEEGDLSFGSLELWFVPLTSLTFAP